MSNRQNTGLLVFRRTILSVICAWVVIIGCTAAAGKEFRRLPELQLNHYAAPAPITFTGKTKEAHAAAIRAYLSSGFPDLDMDALPVREMIAGMVLMVKGPTSARPVLVGKYYNQVIRAYNAFPPIAEAVAGSKTPPEFQERLTAHYSSLLIKRGLGCDTDSISALLRGIPESGTLVSVGKDETLAGHVVRLYPVFADLPAHSRKAIYDYLSAINPDVDSAGWYRTQGQVKENSEHVAMPVPGKGTHVALYRVASNGLVLIPPAAALERIAREAGKRAEPKYPGMDPLTGAVVKKTGPQDAGLAVLSFIGSPPVSLCDYTVLTIPFDDGPIWERDPFATMPALNPLTHAVDVSGLKIDGNTLKGRVLISVRLTDGGGPVACDYTIDAVCTGDAISGTFAFASESLSPGGSGAKQTVKSAGKISGRRITSSVPVPDGNRLAPGSSFSAWRGSLGNGSSPPPDGPLVDSPQKMRLVWRSADYVPTARPAWPLRGGGFASPIIARDRVYTFYYAPSGSYYYESAIARAKAAIEAGRKGKGVGASMKVDREEWRIDADDVFHCLDAASGWTLWRTAFKEQGVSYRRIGAGSEKSGAHLTPAVSMGPGRAMVYAMGTAGKVYAVDAADGEPVWQSDIGERAEAFEYFRAHARKNSSTVPLNRDMCGCAAVADGVVACNNHVVYQGGQRWVGNGMVAFDRFTGKRLWEVEDCLGWFGSPIRWTHGGREYFIAVGPGAVCVEPATGKVLWKIPEAGGDNAPAVTEEYLVCGSSSGAGMTAYRITPQGAKKAWSIGPSSGLCCMLILDGRVYAQCSTGTSESLLCIDLESGKTLGSAPIGGGISSSLMGSGGRIVRERAAKGDGALIMINADPAHIGQMGEALGISYANSVTPSIVDGRMFVRGLDAMYCYDLRAAAGSASAAAESLVRALESKDRRLVLCAVAGLGNLGPAGGAAVPRLASILKGSKSDMWDAAAMSMAGIGPAGRKTAVDALSEVVGSDRKRIRSSLALLSKIGPSAEKGTREAAVRAAVGVLRTGDVDSRKAAAECLGEFGPGAVEAAPALEKAYLETPLRDAARAALEKIRPGQPIRVTPEMDIPDLGELD